MLYCPPYSSDINIIPFSFIHDSLYKYTTYICEFDLYNGNLLS